MKHNSQSYSPKYICEKAASRVYGMSTYWFQRQRWQGTGPPYKKFGRSVRYNLADLDEYFSSIDK